TIPCCRTTLTFSRIDPGNSSSDHTRSTPYGCQTAVASSRHAFLIVCDLIERSNSVLIWTVIVSARGAIGASPDQKQAAASRVASIGMAYRPPQDTRGFQSTNAPCGLLRH